MARFNIITKTIILALATTGSVLGEDLVGNAYFCKCNGCKCNSFYDYTGFLGTTPCLPLSGGATSVGLTRTTGIDFVSYQTTCSLYNTTDCTGDHQSVGVNHGEGWGCSASETPLAQSARCYFHKG
jgi:hypothetical protein